MIEYRGLFIFYMIILAGFILNTIGCSAQKFFNDNMYAKHVIGFFTLFIFVTLVSSSDTTDDEFIFFKKFGASILLYLIFILSTKTKGIFFYIALGLIAVNFLLYSYIDTLDKVKFKTRIEKLTNIATWCGRISIMVIVVGVIVYYIKQREDYGENFNWETFFIGKVQCNSIKEYNL